MLKITVIFTKLIVIWAIVVKSDESELGFLQLKLKN